jgi:transposase
MRRPSTRRIAWWLLKPEKDRTPDEQSFVQELENQSPELQQTAQVSRQFQDMVRQRSLEAWQDWLAQAATPEVSQELRAFARGLREDEKAVTGALSLPWSNGQVEGQVNRLKMIKRQMYGRAGFELLRRRVLPNG